MAQRECVLVLLSVYRCGGQTGAQNNIFTLSRYRVPVFRNDGTVALQAEAVVQAWRTTQFSAEDPDSRLEITFEPAESGTRVRVLIMYVTCVPSSRVSVIELPGT